MTMKMVSAVSLSLSRSLVCVSSSWIGPSIGVLLFLLKIDADVDVDWM